jgi:hypothetical protein
MTSAMIRVELELEMSNTLSINLILLEAWEDKDRPLEELE